MGKYSLENYSFYETYKIRPKPGTRLGGDSERGRYQLLSYGWEELEPERGRYCLEQLKEALEQERNAVLSIDRDIPSWMWGVHGGPSEGFPGEYREEGFACLLRSVGSFLGQMPNMVGVIISSDHGNRWIWDAYREAFADTVLLARLEEEELIRYLKENKQDFGLMVNCSEANWVICCERFARLGLQHTWEQRPVVLCFPEEKAGPHILRESYRWHAAFANRPMDIGYDFTLRRLTFPKKIAGGGGLPVRFWFVNTGSAPCYQEFHLMLRLWKENASWECRLNVDRTRWGVGDITHNEIIPLPELEEGTFFVSVGIFFTDGTFLELNVQAEEQGGYYKMGEIEVDHQIGNNLLHAWDDFYPDGYYPLEDPKTPKES